MLFWHTVKRMCTVRKYAPSASVVSNGHPSQGVPMGPEEIRERARIPVPIIQQVANAEVCIVKWYFFVCQIIL